MRLLLLFFILLTTSVAAKTLPATNFKITHDFINTMVKNHQFDKNELKTLLYYQNRGTIKKMVQKQF